MKSKKCHISAEKFVAVVVANDITDGKPKYDYQLARELGISRQWFYDLFRKYAGELMKAREIIRHKIYEDAVKALSRQLKSKSVRAEFLRIAFDESRVDSNQQYSQPVNLDFNSMSTEEIERYMNKFLREAQQINRMSPHEKRTRKTAKE